MRPTSKRFTPRIADFVNREFRTRLACGPDHSLRRPSSTNETRSARLLAPRLRNLVLEEAMNFAEVD